MLSRRDFFTVGTKIKEDKQSDILIYVFQRGAADGLNLVVPYGDADYYTNRPNLAISAPSNQEASAIDLDGFFGLNPELSPFLALYENNNLAMVHACGSLETSHSHFETQAFIDRGAADTSIATGWLARYANSYEFEDSTAFKSIAMSNSINKGLAGAKQVVALNSIESFTLLAPESQIDAISEQLKGLYDSDKSLDSAAQATFAAIDDIATIQIDDFPIENEAQYPATSFANKLKDLAVLIKSGVGVELASVDIGGWDTHNGQDEMLKGLCQDFSQSLAAFYADMGDLMANISIIALTEFGRRATENGSAGTDHGSGNVAFVMGGGVNGGQVYSDWPGLSQADLVGPGDLAVTTDYRTIITEFMDKRMAYNDFDTLFPNFEVPDYLGLFKRVKS